MSTILKEGYTYVRGNRTNVKPVEIQQGNNKPIPPGIFTIRNNNGNSTTNTFSNDKK